MFSLNVSYRRSTSSRILTLTRTDPASKETFLPPVLASISDYEMARSDQDTHACVFLTGTGETKLILPRFSRRPDRVATTDERESSP